MVLGIDSYHDSAQKGRSVGGVIASMNQALTRYYSRCIFQSKMQELLDGLKICMKGQQQKPSCAKVSLVALLSLLSFVSSCPIVTCLLLHFHLLLMFTVKILYAFQYQSNRSGIYIYVSALLFNNTNKQKKIDVKGYGITTIKQVVKSKTMCLLLNLKRVRYHFKRHFINILNVYSAIALLSG